MANESSRGTSPESGGGSRVAGSAYASLAAEAAAHLRANGHTIESLRGDTEEIDGQATCLVEWAKRRNVLLTEGYFAGLRKHGDYSAEHEVFVGRADNRVVKRTYAGTFGVTPDVKGEQRHATPLFYLQRLELMNRVFRSDFRMEGVMLGRSLLIEAGGEQASIVVSQPWIEAVDRTDPHPSVSEIKAFMELLGFVIQRSSYFGWWRAADNITVLDARRDNFIKSDSGVVPIDLVISQG